MNRALGIAPAIVLAVGCAKGKVADNSDAAPGGADSAISADASCGQTCDTDGDHVPDPKDKCPNTPLGEPVNLDGCSDSQLMATLNPNFPPYGLTWSPSGDPGRAGGLTWAYSAINRGDLFHIYWLVCDDPTTPCGLSLAGPIDDPAKWALSIPDTDLPNGKLVFKNTTHIALADGSNPALDGRLTVQIFDESAAETAAPFSNVAVLNITARTAQYGAEITGTAFKVTVLAEVQDPSSGTWTPALDYYDAAPTPDTGTDAGGPVYQSFDGEFYDK